MKIIRLSTFLDFGGVETRLANVSHIQDENEWVFVCMNNAGRAADTIRNNNKKVINLNTKPSIYSLKTLMSVYRIIKKEKPDVIHTSGAEANFHGILAAWAARIPTIIGEEIGTPSHSRKAQLIFSLVYKFANYIIGNSQNVLAAVHQLDKVPQRKLVKIDNPVIFRDLHGYKSLNKNPLEFSMVMISRLEPVKNIEGVLNVLVKLKGQIASTLKLSVVGTGTSEPFLKSRVKQLALSDIVEFVGLTEDPYPYLISSDLYILNSFSEGFSNSLVESMYSRTLSLSTAVGAAPEIIEDAVNGFLIPPNTEDALYSKLEAIMKMPVDKRKDISDAGHQTIIERFSLQNHIKALMKIYIK